MPGLAAVLVLVLVLVLSLAALGCCSSGKVDEPSAPPTDYQGPAGAIENKVTTGSASLNDMQAVLVSVDGERPRSATTGTAPARGLHACLVGDQSVVSTLVGIAIADGIIDGLIRPWPNCCLRNAARCRRRWPL